MKKLTTFYTYWKGQYTKISPAEIRFVEVRDDSCMLHLEEVMVMTEDSMEKIMSYLPEEQFLKVRHKYIINRRFITGMSSEHVYIDKVKLPLRSADIPVIKITESF